MTVDCLGARHQLCWHQGTIEPVDHPELEAELALVALGGEEPPCIALHRLWHDAIDDGGFVAEWVDPGRLNPTWLSWLSMALERMRAEGFHEFLRHLPHARAQRMGEFLRRFPPAWVDRAGAEVNRRWCHELGPAPWTGPEATLLAQAAANRLRRSFVDAVGGRQLAVGAAALIPLAPVVLSAPDATSAASGALSGAGRGVRLAVDRRWLHQVWAAGAAVVDGHLVLAIDGDPTGPNGATARIVTWAGGQRPSPIIEDRVLRHRRNTWLLDR